MVSHHNRHSRNDCCPAASLHGWNIKLCNTSEEKIFRGNMKAHYAELIWASRCIRLLTPRLIVQQFFQAENSWIWICVICSCEPTKGSFMRKNVITWPSIGEIVSRRLKEYYEEGARYWHGETSCKKRNESFSIACFLAKEIESTLYILFNTMIPSKISSNNV